MKHYRKGLILLLLVWSLLPLPVFASPAVCFPVTLEVTGNAPEGCCIRLTAEDGAPMPDTSDITLTAPGTAQFPPIVYRTPGVYHYTIAQIPGSFPGAAYDPASYTATVTVTDGEGGLQTTATLIKDGKKHESAAFHNDYSLPTAPLADTLIQTGQMKWPVWALGGAGAALLAVGAALRKRDKNA